MTKQDLIYKIRVKMDADPTAESEDYYLNYYDTLINECLSIVANTILPYQKAMSFNWKGYLYNDSLLPEKGDDGDYYTVGEEIDSESESGKIIGYSKRKDWVEWKDGKWQIQPRNNYGFLATIPNDFLSFSNEASTEFRNQYGELILNVDVLYVNSKTLALSKDGNYKLYYNAEYPEIDNSTKNLDFIPTNVLKIIPTYVAGQLLMGEDPIKATQLKNEFELMLSRLDDNKPLIPYNINNSDGWVL